MSSIGTPLYRACEITDLAAIQAFRRQAYAIDHQMAHPIDPTLISDRWDVFSTHIGVVFGNHLVGTVRFAPPVERQLPVQDQIAIPLDRYLTNHQTDTQIRELSRGLIHPNHRNILSATILARAI